eukprot:356133-Chlamydomonas_euryale.AAC.15
MHGRWTRYCHLRCESGPVRCAGQRLGAWAEKGGGRQKRKARLCSAGSRRAAESDLGYRRPLYGLKGSTSQLQCRRFRVCCCSCGNAPSARHRQRPSQPLAGHRQRQSQPSARHQQRPSRPSGHRRCNRATGGGAWWPRCRLRAKCRRLNGAGSHNG